MTQPQWERVDSPTADLLSLVADPDRATGRDAVALFLAACEADADGHGGYVSVNRVRARLAGEGIQPRRYSALWSQFTGPGKPMTKTREWEVCAGSPSGNDGRPFALRRWLGGAP